MRAPLGPIDHAWLRMERPDNPMMITGVLTFDEPLELPRLRATLDTGLRPFARFRQRVRTRRLGRRAVWEDDPSFTIDRHLEHRVLAPPADRRALSRMIGELLSTPLPRDRPLWALHVLERPGDGRTVLVARLHHCIADGFALMHVLLGLTDEAPGAPPDAMSPAPRPAMRPSALSIGADLVRLATLKDQPDSVLRGPLGRQKRAAWSAPIALSEVKTIARGLGGTVNDALMSATAGALARYLRERGEDPSGFELRAAVPVNLRASERMDELGNRFGLVFLELPLGIDDARARFDELKRRMDRLKRSPEAAVLLSVMRIVGAAPGWLEKLVVRVLGTKTTAVLTNVPGPQGPRYLAGRRIQTIMFWVPQSGRVSLGISIFSYAGQVRLGLAADALHLPDPARVLEAFPEELEALRGRVFLQKEEP